MRSLQYINKQRPVSDVPKSIKLLLLVTIIVQIVWHGLQEPVVTKAENLSSPLSVSTYTIASLGEPVAISKILNLWLQSFDHQPGSSLSFHQLDYPLLTKWFDTILALDPKGYYPMLVAARVYGSVNNAAQQKIMLEYIYEKFNQSPEKYWRWLAHAVITAKHELKNNKLALKYASALAEVDSSNVIPYWAKDMRIIVLEDMGELEAAQILVGALLDGGQITDPYEINFLTQKIQVLEKKLLEK